MGLVSLLPLQAELLPQELQSGLDQVFKAVLKLLVAYKQQLEGILVRYNLEGAVSYSYASEISGFIFLESAKRGDEVEDNGELEGLDSDEDDDWEKELEDDDEDGDEVDSRKFQKLATQVCLTHILMNLFVSNFKYNAILNWWFLVVRNQASAFHREDDDDSDDDELFHFQVHRNQRQ